MNRHVRQTEATDSIERLLAGQTPRSPSRALDERMTELFAESSTQEPIVTRRSCRWFAAVVGPIAAAAAVGLAVFILWRPDEGRTVISPAPVPSVVESPALRIDPVRIEQTISNLVPGPVVAIGDDQYVRPMQYQTIRRTRWINSATNVSVEVNVPRDDLILVPVRFD